MENNLENNLEHDILIKLLIDKKIKPDLSKYNELQLENIYSDFTENKNNYLKKINISIDAQIVIQNICNEIKIMVDIQQTVNELWKKFPLLNNEGEIVECMICLNYITNSDNIIFECEHITHSSCFLNYLFSNLKNMESNDANLLKLFRCPKCRSCVTEKIKKTLNSADVERQNIVNDNNNNQDEDENEQYMINQGYGDEYNNFIFQEYNLIENSIDNLMLNNIFRASNNITINNIITNNNDPNIIINNDEETNSNLSNYNTDDDDDDDDDENEDDDDYSINYDIDLLLWN